ncbi:tripartite tricarboxylate transporter substrate-binding protein [Xenophilus arseniciresistens]|uniref:Tripartite tricarboxylate transporter substrate-binding protein n=1 Tax=Xenophilus arseniciresistens TaxID=1283306 RepID=A0AAE3T1U6_9BURK|nr:tripartite tricarboxylate transporter substrate-binding protein [Xenophilus arseniciresistens]MDA7418985.1 tripartite tricarboxylate transporter substrate-binding protein [Xenophilus arseniciresistens]
MHRRTLIAGALLALAATVPAQARDNWPERPIRFIVPAAAGGTNDVLGRYIQEPLQKLLGQPVVMEYKPGAGGAIASQYVAQQPADGYTFLLHGSGLVTVPLVQSKPSYSAIKDFEPVSLLGSSPMVLMAHPSTAETLTQFVQQARAKPGSLEWGASALGGVGQLAMVAFHDAAGIRDMVMVPYPGAGPAAQALLSGQTKYMLSTPSSVTAGFVKEGRMRILGVSTAQRSPLLPDVPSISEAVPGYHTETWFGLVARTGTPPQVVSKLADAVAKVLAQPDIQQKFQAIYVVPKSGTQALGDIIRSDNALWEKVVKANHITMD